MWQQKFISISQGKRGCHLITEKIHQAIHELEPIDSGLVHLFLQHTSASLILTENADPDVRSDLEMAGDKIAPITLPYRHILEGQDDMPAHLKSAIFGYELTIPIKNHQMLLGTWQGICLWEHRNHPATRTIVLTLQGQPRDK